MSVFASGCDVTSGGLVVASTVGALSDVGTGVHRVEVQARIDLGAAAQTGEAVARATIGKGSMTVEEVRMIRGEDVSF